MKKMNLGATTTTMGLFTTSGTWAFMQDSWTEISAQILIGLIGSSYNSSAPYILYGCVATVGGSDTTITAGAIFYNGEVYLAPSPAPFINPTAGNVIVCTLNTANNYTEPDGATLADMASYEDGTPRNTYDIRTIGYTTGPSGGGSVSGYKFDFSALTQINLPPQLQTEINEINTTINEITGQWTNAGTPGVTTTGGGGFTLGTVVYNKYQQIGQTFFWQLQLTGCTVTGTPNTLRIYGPPAIFGTEMAPIGTYFGNGGDKQCCGSVDFGGQSNPLFAELNNTGGGSAIGCIDLFWNTPWSAGGANNLYVNIIGELISV